MNKLILTGVLLLALPLVAPAQSPKKSTLNTNLYENENSSTSVNGKVKAIREVQEETEVFMETKGNSGPYVLPQNIKNRAKALKSLKKSQKPGGPSVTISIDSQQHITSVEESESSEKSQPQWEF